MFLLQNLCCLSVVKDFHKLKKYNIHSIMEGTSQDGDSKPTEEGVGSKTAAALPAVCTTKDASPHIDSCKGKHTAKDKDEATDINVQTGDPSCEGEHTSQRTATASAELPVEQTWNDYL